MQVLIKSTTKRKHTYSSTIVWHSFQHCLWK